MSTNIQNMSGGKEDQNASKKNTTGANQEEVQISLPKDKESIGPFEHSGETAGWTATEEKQEKPEEEQ